MIEPNVTRADAAPASSTTVVVGNGPVGHAFVRRSLELAGRHSSRLVVFGEETRPAYDRIRLTNGLTDGSFDALTLSPREWYEEHDVVLHTGDPVVAIDRDPRTVTSRSGRTVEYDQLVLATGSRAFVPPIEGHDKPGVFVYRTIDDVEAIRDEAGRCRSAAVLGGGLLGLEAARALLDMGLETHVVEAASVLMARQLDTPAAELLGRFVEELGVVVHLLHRTARVLGDDRCRGLVFDDGVELPVDMLVVAAGIRPRDELARECGLDVGPRGGIVVDDRLRTSDRNVFAIGECALHRETIYGLAGPGYRMADVLARTLAGERAKFEGSDESTRLKLMGVDVSLCGDYLDPAGGEVLTHETDGTYRKLVLRRNRLVGAIGVGSFPELPRVQEAIANRRRVRLEDRRRFVAEGSVWEDPEGVDVAAWPECAVVCGCTGVTRGELSDALAEGACSAEELAARTRASTVCGTCRPLLGELAGRPTRPAEPVPWRTLLGASLVGLVACLFFAFGPIPYAISVRSTWYAIEALWREAFWKQVTGFSLLGLTGLALLISLRKRIAWLRWGSLPWWRVAHAVLGVTTLVGLAVHTGLHLGSNLNLCLMLVFLAINVLGVASGVVAAMESGLDPRRARIARRWRPRLVWMHALAVWPFPILVAFHVLAFYYM